MLFLESQPATILARPYQVDILDAVAAADKDHQSSMVVAPTGTGKTVCFSMLAQRDVDAGRRVLIIVDRDELVHQTARTIYNLTGIDADIEQAGSYANEHSKNLKKPIVIGTIQTLHRFQRSLGIDRMARFKAAEFGRVIVDECHLSITPSYKKVLAYFTERNPAVRITGFTATPMRGDGKSLRQVYSHCAFRYNIRDAIDDGWLVPVTGHQVALETLDLSQLPSKGKRDWSDAEIGRLMEENETIFATVATLAERARNRPTLVFCARVAHAELMARVMNDQVGSMCARAVSGETDATTRRRIIDDFRDGKINYLMNCAVLTTGFDAPVVEVVANCRPTKSAALFIQCVGRGLRPLPGLVDGLEDADDRRAAIAASKKPECEVISFVGRDGGVDLCGPEDVLAGSMDEPEVVKRAKELAAGGDTRSVSDRLDAAKDEIETEKRARLRVKAEYQIRKDDLFGRGGASGMKLQAGGMATPGQMRVLTSAGVEASKLREMQYDKNLAGYLASEIMKRRAKGLATYKQCRMLQRAGYDKAKYRHYTVAQASALIDRTKNNGWKKVDL